MRKQTIAGVLLGIASLAVAHAQNVFVVPTGSSSTAPMSIFYVDPFTAATQVPGTATTISVLSTPDASKFFVVDSSGTVTVLKGSDFSVAGTNTFGPVRAAAISPDGTRLVLAGNNLLLIDTANIGGQPIASVDAGLLPDDTAVSIDGKIAYAVSTQSARVTAVDTGSGLVLATQNITGGIERNRLSVGPDGTVYASAQNRLYILDPKTLKIAGQIAVNGNPGRLAFNTDGAWAAARDVRYGNAAVLFLFDLKNKNVSTVTTAGFGDRFDSVVYGGKNAAGQERFFPFSRTTGNTYEVTPLNLLPTVVAFSNGIQNPASIAASTEVAPRYLFVASGDNYLWRVNLATSQRDKLAINGPNGTLMVAGAGSTAPAATFQIFSGNGQTVGTADEVAPLVVRILDANGRPVVNAAVSFTGPTGLTFNNVSAATNGLGYAFATPVNPGNAGQYTITIKSGSVSTTTALNVTGSGNGGGGGPVGPTSRIVIVSGNGQASLGAQVLQNPLVVQVVDANGNPVPNAPISLTLDQTGANGSFRPMLDKNGVPLANLDCTAITSCTGKTDANGKAIVQIYLNPVNSFNAVQSTVINITSGTLKAQATEIATGTNTFLNVALITPTDPNAVIKVPAGGTLPGAVQVGVRAAGGFNNNGPVKGLQLTAYTPANDPYAVGENGTGPTITCGGDAALTNSQGVATCDLVAGSTLGATQLRLYIGGRLFRLNAEVVQGQPSKIKIVSNGDQTVAAGKTGTAMLGQVVDSAGNPLSGVAVTWTAQQGITLQNAQTTTNSQGQVSAVPVAGNTPGTYTVTLKAGDKTGTFTVRVSASLGALTTVSGDHQSAQPGHDYAQPLVVKLTDANGNAAANVTISFAVTSGGATLSSATATTDAQGLAQVKVTAPATATSNIVITASVGTLSQAFNLTAADKPVFTMNNLKNGAGYQVQQGVAPGQILNINWTGIAPTGQGVIAAPNLVGLLPTKLADVQVTFSGIPAPIFYVQNENGVQQVAVQVPFELQPGALASIVLTVDGTSSTLDNVPVVPAAPGTFMTTDANGNTYAVAIHTDGSYVTIDNPAHIGETIRVFSTGLGTVTPSTGTNRVGTGGQSATLGLLVGLGNGGVRVTGSEYVAGLLGVYLVDFEVPSDAPTGNAVPLSVNTFTPDGTQVIYGNTTTIPIR